MKVPKLVFIIVLFIITLFVVPSRVSAIDDCTAWGVKPGKSIGVTLPNDTPTHNVTFDDLFDGTRSLDPNTNYYIEVFSDVIHWPTQREYKSDPQKPDENGNLEYPITIDYERIGNEVESIHYIFLRKGSSESDIICLAGDYTTEPALPSCPPGKIYVYQKRDVDVNGNGKIDPGAAFGEEAKACYAPKSCIAENQDIFIEVQNLSTKNNPYSGNVRANISVEGHIAVDKTLTKDKPGFFHGSTRFNELGDHTIELSAGLGKDKFPQCSVTFDVKGVCDNQPTMCGSVQSGEGQTSTELRKLCENIPAGELRDRCTNCVDNPTKPNPGAWTAIGCIETDPKTFIKQLLGFAVGIAGGIAFLMILFGGFQIITSTGDPEKLTAGRELVSAAVTGLLFIIFSLFILRLIGVSILGLPGFG